MEQAYEQWNNRNYYVLEHVELYIYNILYTYYIYIIYIIYMYIDLNWDSLHAKLNSHYEARNYKKKKYKKIEDKC